MQLSFECVWFDEHMIEIEIVADSDRTRSVSRGYTAIDTIRELGVNLLTDALLRGQTICFGVSGYGSTEVTFKLHDHKGPIRIHIEVNDGSETNLQNQLAFDFLTDQASLDRLGRFLRSFKEEIGCQAALIQNDF